MTTIYVNKAKHFSIRLKEFIRCNIEIADFIAVFAFTSLGLFNKVFFYAEPGFQYHVRTILGQEKAVNDVGYNMYLFGRYNAWKKAMTVQASDNPTVSVNAEIEAEAEYVE